MEYNKNILMKIFVTSKVGLFVLIHWTLLILAFYIRDGSIYSSIHFHYEPVLLKLILFLDLPAISIAEFLSMPLNELMINHYPSNGVLIFVGCISVQWIIIGYIVEQLFLKIRSTNIK